MKKMILLILFTNIILFANTELKDGNYSWYNGGSQAYLSVKKVKKISIIFLVIAIMELVESMDQIWESWILMRF